MNTCLQSSRTLKIVSTRNGIEEKKMDFVTLVEKYYASLYRFALSLSKNEADALDLTQQTFHHWAKKGYQFRDFSKIKSCLFTTLHRVFLSSRRHEICFPHYGIENVDTELPNITSDIVSQMDKGTIARALMEVEEHYRVPLVLYFENHSYQEIADFLNTPIRNVGARLFRGKRQLRQILSAANRRFENNVALLER